MKLVNKRFMTIAVLLMALLLQTPAFSILATQSEKSRTRDTKDVKALSPYSKGATKEEVRQHFYGRFQVRLKAKNSLKDGWQTVHVTRRGTALLAFVKGGQVTQHIIGKSHSKALLLRYAPTGKLVAAPTKRVVPAYVGRGDAAPRPTGGVEMAPKDSEPTEDECALKIVRCMFGACENPFDYFKFVVNVFTLDVEDIEQQIEDNESCIEKCAGACKKYLD